eukprot:CAMPEP_0117590418 /NCGR_PEP_ID=MMETSP0784-20121206/70965_1 /TAXON_ID=39447 /ORGANISM="" /LENGTH=273 /DNA_ID=CAMNT_0005392025 /DNA_START=175 /DNA_END=996 /DNA_ORIENTATION=-
MACRSTARGEEAMAALTAQNPEWKERLTVLEMDTSSDSSVTAAATTLEAKFGRSPPPLHSIVNNAGIAAGTVADILNVNVRGPKRVDDAFLPLLDPQRGRIVQMSSGAASGCVSRCSAERRAFFTDANITWEQISNLVTEVESYPNGAKDLEAHGLGNSMGVYGLSKALLNSYTMLLARENPELKINACSPGMIATDIIASILPWWVPIPTAAVVFLARQAMGAKTPDEGTVSTMHLLFAEDLQGNGRYYGSDAKRSPLDKYRSPGSPPYEGP